MTLESTFLSLATLFIYLVIYVFSNLFDTGVLLNLNLLVFVRTVDVNELSETCWSSGPQPWGYRYTLP